MTRRDFRNLAYILYVCKSNFKSRNSMRDFVEVLCNCLHADNPRFDRAKFLEAVYDPTFWEVKTEEREKQMQFFEGV